jgi:hypothetical protein
LTVTITRRRALWLFGALALIAASVAIGAWLISSQGGGKSQIGTLVAPTVTPAASAPSQACLPGGDCPVALAVDNPNPSGLLLTGMAAGTDASQNGGVYTNGGNSINCFAFLSVQSVSGLSLNVPVGQSIVTVPGGAHLASETPTECQGIAVTRAVRADFSTP